MGCCGSKPENKGQENNAKPEKKQRISERRKLLDEGRAGSLGVKLGSDGDMKVSSVTGDAGGLRAGDLIVVVTTTEHDDDFDDNDKEPTPVRDRLAFMRASGPRRDIFEGCTLPITVIRDPAEQKAFLSKAKGLKKDKDWLSAVKEHKPLTFNVRVKPETEGVRSTRLKKINKIKADKKLDKMDVNLVSNVMANPTAAKTYARQHFNQADSDGSRTLTRDEVAAVFEELAGHIGCKVPSKGDIKDLVKVMDANKTGVVSFNEFFPIFRWKMIQLVSDMLDD